MNIAHTYEEKEAYFRNILDELKNTGIKVISNKEISKKFLEKNCSLRHRDFIKLNIRKRLIEYGIMSRGIHSEEKKIIFEKLLLNLLENNVTKISNKKLISLMKTEYSITLREGEIVSLGLRNLLENNGITSAKVSKISVIDDTLKYLLENDIVVSNITMLHKYTEKFGAISRSTLDNNLDYIQKRIKIKNMKDTKRIKALNMTDEEIIIESAKYYIKKSVFKVTASELRRFTNSRYRAVNIEVIKSYKNFLREKYDLEMISIGNSQESQNYQVDYVLDFLKNNKSQYSIQEIKVFDENVLSSIGNDVFVLEIGLSKDLELFWNEYTSLYIKELAKHRINVKNSFLNEESSDLRVDTEKKEVILLVHEKINIKNITMLEFIKLTMLIHKSANKSCGIHMQNMYIGFLLFLHSNNKLIIPFSYLYDVCYIGKKVQVELSLFLAEHPINKQFLRAIGEKRLNIKDDKYKRIFQFFLLCLPKNKPISSILYSDLSSLQDRSEKDFKRVSEILNSLGANIVIDKAKEKYTDRYNQYVKKSKYFELGKVFTKVMDRTYKLGDYSKEDNIYKSWSMQYAQFFDFIEQNYTNANISESFLYQLFDYPEEEKILTYQEYIQEQQLSAGAKDKRFTPLIVAFSISDKYLSLKNLKDKKPIFQSTNENTAAKQNRGAITNPNVLVKLEDILRNRPPKSEYFTILDIDKKYTSWWKHYHNVAPFEPLILLMHLYIPARGINFRLVDRNSFLVKNDQGITTGYHFTHDKNKKRKQPYIAPNIWGDDLQIIEDFIEYTKVHFNTLKPIKYDKQNPYGIVPLFPNRKGTNFYLESQHMKYWKRVLLKAQIELNNEKNNEKIVLIYPKSNMVLPENSDDVDKLSQGDIEKFQVRYDLHSLRHTGATKYANAGMPMGLVALLTGHIDMNVLQSVYVELDAQKMIAMWQNIQHVDIGDSTLAEAGKTLINSTVSIAKEVLFENSPEKLLAFLEKGHFLSIGSYLNKDDLTKYRLEDFAKIDPVFWSFKRHGICTSSQCPEGLQNRCSMCPHFITSIYYVQEIVSQINLQTFRLGKYGNMIIDNREKGNPEGNENIRKSIQIEMEDMLGWIEILRMLDEIIVLKNENMNVPNTNKKNLTTEGMQEMSIFSLAPIINSNHALLKLVYDSLELKQFEHESLHDAAGKLVSKIIRYAARENRYQEIDGIDKYQILEWFQPVYQKVLTLEKDDQQKNKLKKILDVLSNKPITSVITSVKVKLLEERKER